MILSSIVPLVRNLTCQEQMEHNNTEEAESTNPVTTRMQTQKAVASESVVKIISLAFILPISTLKGDKPGICKSKQSI